MAGAMEDEMFLQALEIYEASQRSEQEEILVQPQTISDDGHFTQLNLCDRFVNVTEEEILAKIKGAVPRTTKRSTEWAVSVWRKWRDSKRLASDSEYPPELDFITNEEVNRWLARFVFEVRTLKGEEYSGESLYGLCSGIQRYIREKRSDRNDEPIDLAHFRSSFNAVLKDLHSRRIGTVKKQASVITEDVENQLWLQNILGDDTPSKLLNTLVYCLGVNLALHSGREHCSLRPDTCTCMFQLVELPDGRCYLEYIEWGSKNNAGGLRDRKNCNKSVKIFPNVENPQRCVIRLYQKYLSLRPENAPSDALYLQPLHKPRPECWYQSKAVGHNSLTATVKKIIDQLGISGYYTNHSLRRTCVTRLYQSGAEEYEIMKVSGHRSKDGVRAYKEMSQAGREDK
ncbi:PREDICTED: zinc finger MYM-type protein 2-like [Amphimedon queenslandica]|uniref:Uncharacterized protein n=1 Tax=Amphimedon queenslandica TaxID=400682 RepID=A0A1X7SSB0_AMPQE|nr:PREDICTED: zinc finger MYM-type protein 2-like [Amphimedon queenslandica]|eukprot:XP_011408935.1 PREDICTED: zinc finger MYM-type protein 2-like [Amphimedon queenslandica]